MRWRVLECRSNDLWDRAASRGRTTRKDAGKKKLDARRIGLGPPRDERQGQVEGRHDHDRHHREGADAGEDRRVPRDERPVRRFVEEDAHAQEEAHPHDAQERRHVLAARVREEPVALLHPDDIYRQCVPAIEELPRQNVCVLLFFSHNGLVPFP